MSTRRDRRMMDAALANLGRSLLRTRDAGVWEAEGFANFAAFCRARVAADFTARDPRVAAYLENCNPDQVDQVVERALELATRRRKRRPR